MNREELLSLSRKKDRSHDETEALYSELEKLAILSKSNSQYIGVIYELIYPSIKNIAVTLYKKWKGNVYTVSIGELEQQAYLILEKGLNRFKPEKNVYFLYYIENYIGKTLLGNLQREAIRLKRQIATIVVDSQARDRRLKAKDPYYYNLEREYITDELKRMMISFVDRPLNKRKDIVEILEAIIYDKKGFQELADENNISYHALYQLFSRHKLKLAKLINESKLFTYYIDYSDIKKSGQNYIGKYRIVQK